MHCCFFWHAFLNKPFSCCKSALFLVQVLVPKVEARWTAASAGVSRTWTVLSRSCAASSPLTLQRENSARTRSCASPPNTSTSWAKSCKTRTGTGRTMRAGRRTVNCPRRRAATVGWTGAPRAWWRSWTAWLWVLVKACFEPMFGSNQGFQSWLRF